MPKRATRNTEVPLYIRYLLQTPTFKELLEKKVDDKVIAEKIIKVAATEKDVDIDTAGVLKILYTYKRGFYKQEVTKPPQLFLNRTYRVSRKSKKKGVKVTRRRTELQHIPSKKKEEVKPSQPQFDPRAIWGTIEETTQHLQQMLRAIGFKKITITQDSIETEMHSAPYFANHEEE